MEKFLTHYVNDCKQEYRGSLGAILHDTLNFRPTGATNANIKSHLTYCGAYVRLKQYHPEALPNKSGTKTSN